MSRMTSSSNKAARSAHKPFTDFSIETIIGARQAHQQSSIEPPKQEAGNHRTNYAVDETKMLRLPAELADQHRPDPSNEYAQRKYRPKNFQCPACKMAFSNNGQLKNHVRIHTGERPFTCNQPGCNKTFTRNEELTRHKLIHSGVRPHACTTCGKRFGRKDHLKKHVRTHDRKRLRKRVFVPRSLSLAEEMEDVFATSKPSIIVDAQRPIDANTAKSRLVAGPTNTLNAFSRFGPTHSLPSLPPPETPFIPSTTLTLPVSNTSSAGAITTTSASSTLQQLASIDYWSKWYNLIGFYHHQQHYTPVDRLRNCLFRK